MLRYIEIAEARGTGLYEPLILLVLMLLTFAYPRRTYSGTKLSLSAVRFLMLSYFPIYLLSLSLDTWGKAGSNLHHAAQLAMWMAYIRLGLITFFDLCLPRIRGAAVPKIMGDIIHGIVYLAGILWLMRWWGWDAVSILTTGTVLGAIIGLSLQETLGNIFAGLAVQAQRPFQVGDWISLEGHNLKGQVLELNWRTTRVLSEDNEQVDIPNAMIARTPIRNYNAPEQNFELEVSFSAPYTVSPAQVVEIALAAVKAAGLDQRRPECGIANFNDQGVKYNLRFYSSDMHERRDQINSVMTHLWAGLSRRDISIGYPVREVWMNQVNAEPNQEQDVRYHALANLYFTEPLSISDRRSLAKRLKAVQVPKGDVLHIDAESEAACYLIQTGQLAILDGEFTDLPEGADGLLEAGEFFGDMALMTGTPQPGRMQAVSDVSLWKLDREMLKQALSHSQPEVLEAIVKLLAKRCSVIQANKGTDSDKTDPMQNPNEHQILDGVKRLFRLK